MQEDVENKVVRLAVSLAKLTGKNLYDTLHTYMDGMRNKSLNQIAGNGQKTGKQSVKQLIGQGQGVSSVPITETGLRDFKRIANKYGVDFAVVKDKTQLPPKYTVFFKAKDADAITQVMKEYSAKMVKKQQTKKPSLLKTLKKLKALVANSPHKQRQKQKAQTR